MTATENILFLPGAGGDAAFWLPVADKLPATYQFSHLGWPGCAGNPAHDSITCIDDLVAFTLKHITTPSVLIAQSMGGVIATKIAVTYPSLITHLVLTATSGGLVDGVGEDWRPAFRQEHPTFPTWFADYDEDLSATFAQLTIPTLLIWGTHDAISPVARGQHLAGLITHARFEVIAGGDHDMARTHAHTVAQHITSFLSSS